MLGVQPSEPRDLLFAREARLGLLGQREEKSACLPLAASSSPASASFSEA